MATLPFSCISAPLSGTEFHDVLTTLNVDAESIWAILEVESGKAGFLSDRRPQILFERAVFHSRTRGIYDASHPGISASTWGGYSGGAAEYARLGEAHALSPDDALQSVSWGVSQVMGFNYSSAGYSSAVEYVQAMCTSEGAQLKAFESFLMHTGIAASLQAKDWDSVARKYNGPGQVAVYSQRLKDNYARLKSAPAPLDIDVRAAQMYLTFLMSAEDNPAFNPGGIDGVLSISGRSRTLAALNAFQTAKGLPHTMTVDGGVLATLSAALPPAKNLQLA